MNKLSVSVLVALFGTVAVFAQTEPLIRDFPPAAAWIISMNSASSAPASVVGDGSGAKSEGRVLKEIEVNKDGTTRREIYRWSNNQESDRWYYEGMVMVEEPGTRKILVMAENRMGGMQRMMFPSVENNGDFPELSWITPTTPVVEEVKDGRLCLRYQRTSASTQSGAAPVVTMTAWIDKQTRLPVAIQTANETRTYKLIDPKRPVLPTRFRKAMDDYIKAFATN